MLTAENQPCVAMFGTCGSTTHREDYLIPVYRANNMRYYNPQVPEGMWDASMGEEEARHLQDDVVQDWPVTNETYGLKTLSEQGHALSASIRAESPLPHFIIPMIALDLKPELNDPGLRAESLGARKLMTQHLKRSESPNVFLVDSLPEMAEASVILYGAAQQLMYLAQSKNPAYQRYARNRGEAAAYREALASGRLGPVVARIARRKEQ